MEAKRSKPDQYQLRFPAGLRDRLKNAADRNGRSMNAEIIDRLEQSLKIWPRVNLPDDIFDRVRLARMDQRSDLEAEISALAIQAVERALPAAGELHKELMDTFYRLVAKAPEEKRDALKSEFNDLWSKLAQVTAPAKGK